MSTLTAREPAAILAALTTAAPALAAPVPGPGLLAAATAVEAVLSAARAAPPLADPDAAGTAAAVIADAVTVLIEAPGTTLVSRRLADGTTTTQVNGAGADWTIDHAPGGRRRIRVRQGPQVVADWSFGPTGAVDNRDLDAQFARFEELARTTLEAMVPPADLDPPATTTTPATATASPAPAGASGAAAAALGALARAGASSGPAPATPWAPTHDVVTPLPARTAPDPTLAPVATLAPGVQLRLLERLGDWGHVEGSNGWRGWVDARQLAART